MRDEGQREREQQSSRTGEGASTFTIGDPSMLLPSIGLRAGRTGLRLAIYNFVLAGARSLLFIELYYAVRGMP